MRTASRILPPFRVSRSTIFKACSALNLLITSSLRAPGGSLTRSATPSIALLHRQKAPFPFQIPSFPRTSEGKQSAWREGISSRFNEVWRCTSRQNSGPPSVCSICGMEAQGSRLTQRAIWCVRGCRSADSIDHAGKFMCQARGREMRGSSVLGHSPNQHAGIRGA